jgi:hypothetical protein
LGKPVRLNEGEKGAQTPEQTLEKRSGDRVIARDRVIGKTENLYH